MKIVQTDVIYLVPVSVALVDFGQRIVQLHVKMDAKLVTFILVLVRNVWMVYGVFLAQSVVIPQIKYLLIVFKPSAICKKELHARNV
jgi:hypothetical protein